MMEPLSLILLTVAMQETLAFSSLVGPYPKAILILKTTLVRTKTSCSKVLINKKDSHLLNQVQ